MSCRAAGRRHRDPPSRLRRLDRAVFGARIPGRPAIRTLSTLPTVEFRRARSFMTGEELWFSRVPGREVEIAAGGGAEAPDPNRVAQAAWAVERLDALFERAKTYLDHFVERDRLGGGEWRLDSLVLGRCDCDRDDEMDLVLGLSWDEAEWTVRFRIAPLDVTGFFPVEFRRRFI